MMQRLSIVMNEELSSLPLRDDLISSLEVRVRELKAKLESHRSEYNQYADITSRKLLQQISKTVQGWLSYKNFWLPRNQYS